MYQKPCRLTIADKCYGGAPSIPQVDPNQVMQAIRQNLRPMVQTQFGLARDYGPRFARQDLRTSQQYAPQYAQLGLDLNTQFAPQYQSLNLAQMQRAIAGQPLLQSLNTQAQTGLAGEYANLAQSRANLAQGGVDPLLGQLTTQAQQQLTRGGHLSDQEAYQQTQGTLGTFAGRNNVFNQAAAQSFLDRDALVRQRMQEAQRFAGSVEGQRQGALGLAQSGVGLAQSGLGQAQQFGLGTQAANLQGLAGTGGLVNMPNLAAYGAPGASYGPMSAGIGATSGTVGQISPIISEIFGSNQSAAANQAIGGANKTSGIAGGALSAVGSIAAAY